MAISVCGAVASAQTEGGRTLNWRDFKSADGGFSVQFPGTPKVDKSDLHLGPVTLTRHIHSLEIGNMSFDVEYTDLSPGSDPDASMEGGVSGLIRSMTAHGATVLTNETVTRGSCSGREVTLSIVNPGTVTRGFSDTQLFASGLRFFSIIFNAGSDTPAMREIGNTFLKSFTVTGGCTNLVAPVDAPPNKKSEETFEGKADPVSGWRIIESNDLGLRVLMPGTVRHIWDQPQVDPFPLTHHTFIYSNEGTVYSAEVIGDYPPGFRSTPATYQTAIDISLYALRRNLGVVGFEIQPIRDLRLATRPGREFSLINEKAGSHGRAQVYVTPTRIYIFSAFTPSQNALTQISQFYASIRISPK